MKAEIITLHEDRNVTLTAYIQEVEGEFGFSKRPAMLVIPGGGYAMCSDREADAVALAYLKAGFQAFVLRYTCTPKGKWPLPLEDYEEAMSLIEERADTWFLDKERIAVVGFSAGGHLAACAATVAKHRPAAAVLVYPAILKEICDMCQPGMPYPNEHVTPETCPCFLAAARDDKVVPVQNTLKMALVLAEKSVAFETHIYSYGGHGFSTAEDWIVTNSVSSRTPNWVADSIGWLGEVWGRCTRSGYTKPVKAINMNNDFAPILSVDCSIQHLSRQCEEAKLALSPMFAGIEAVAKARGYSVEGLLAAIGGSTAREVMELVQIPEETIAEIDTALHGMINRLDV